MRTCSKYSGASRRFWGSRAPGRRVARSGATQQINDADTLQTLLLLNILYRFSNCILHNKAYLAPLLYFKVYNCYFLCLHWTIKWIMTYWCLVSNKVLRNEMIVVLSSNVWLLGVVLGRNIRQNAIEYCRTYPFFLDANQIGYHRGSYVELELPKNWRQSRVPVYQVCTRRKPLQIRRNCLIKTCLIP